jgi:predicted nucleotidyltransferase
MIRADTILMAARSLLAAAPASRVILFGSHARGNAGPESDLDFLVVEPRVKSRRDEMVRLGDVLRALGIYADVLVMSEQDFQEWRDEPGTVFHEAARTGKVFDAPG